MKAVVVNEDKTVSVQEKPNPSVGPKDVNPTDWKHAAFLSKPGAIIGCDATGIIEQVGSEVPSLPKLQKGARVGFFVRGGIQDNYGAFAEQIAIPYDLAFALPSNLSFEEAASIPIPFFTAAQALFHRLNLDAPTPDKSLPLKSNGKWLLVWSGASAVGQYAVQLGKLAGYKVVTTASQDNWPLLKSLGAELTFDYKTPNVGSAIREATNDGIRYALDCVSTEESQAAISHSLSSKGGHLVTLLSVFPDKIAKQHKATDTIAYSWLDGKDVDFGGWVIKASPNDHEDYIKWLEYVTPLFEQGHVKILPIQNAGGLEDVQKGFDLMKAGKVRAQKLVYTV